MKPFNLEEAKAGKPVCTRDGRNARIFCYDRKNIDNQPIVALIEDREVECVRCYDQYGNYLISRESHGLDLFMKTEKHEGWVNLYKNNEQYITGGVWETENGALQHKDEDYIKTIKIEWEE